MNSVKGSSKCARQGSVEEPRRRDVQGLRFDEIYFGWIFYGILFLRDEHYFLFLGRFGERELMLT